MPKLGVTAYFGLTVIVKQILDSGQGDVNYMDKKWNRSLLSWVAEQGHLDVLELLLDNGADASSREMLGSPLAAAASRGNLEAVHMLIKKGGDNLDLGSALLQAAAREQRPVIK